MGAGYNPFSLPVLAFQIGVSSFTLAAGASQTLTMNLPDGLKLPRASSAGFGPQVYLTFSGVFAAGVQLVGNTNPTSGATSLSIVVTNVSAVNQPSMTLVVAALFIGGGDAIAA